MGRAAKATRGGNKRRINPGRLAKKLTRQGMSERTAKVAARAAKRMSLSAPGGRAAAIANLPKKGKSAAAIAAAAQQQQAAASDDARSVPQEQQPKPLGVKAQIQNALAALSQQRSLQEQRTVVKQAQRRNKK